MSEKSPFDKAKSKDKRVKLFLWGPSGCGKTTLSLQFPRPVVIDCERGTELYGDHFDFDVKNTTDPDEIEKSVKWLMTNDHEYRTLIIDPVTIYWESLQKKWSDIMLRRNKKSSGYKHEFYDLQVKDWMQIKSAFKALMRDLINLDMNVIVTAREKTKYKEGSFMVAIGDTFDGEKSLPYLFDTIVHMYVSENGNFMGKCMKDRSNKLPKDEFKCGYSAFEKAFGKQTLSKKAKKIEYVSDEVANEIFKVAKQVGISEKKLDAGVRKFDADTVRLLKKCDADYVLKKLYEQAKKTKTEKEK